MATSQTQDEVRAENIAVMGAELGELHFLLWHDLTWLHLKWHELQQLFGTKPTRIELMNRTAPTFFSSLEHALWDDVLLHISRMTDPPATTGQQNLSFRRYPPLVARLPIRDRVIQQLDRVDASARFARDWRDKRVAHREFLHYQDPQARPLTAGNRENVEEALDAMRRLQHLFESHFRHSEVAYEYVAPPFGGAEAMLYYLERGLEATRAEPMEGDRWRPHFL